MVFSKYEKERKIGHNGLSICFAKIPESEIGGKEYKFFTKKLISPICGGRRPMYNDLYLL